MKIAEKLITVNDGKDVIDYFDEFFNKLELNNQEIGETPI